jgi:hypothetical protein
MHTTTPFADALGKKVGRSQPEQIKRWTIHSIILFTNF